MGFIGDAPDETQSLLDQFLKPTLVLTSPTLLTLLEETLKLYDLAAEVEFNDHFLLYYARHGVVDDSTDTASGYHLMPRETSDQTGFLGMTS